MPFILTPSLKTEVSNKMGFGKVSFETKLFRSIVKHIQHGLWVAHIVGYYENIFGKAKVADLQY